MEIAEALYFTGECPLCQSANSVKALKTDNNALDG